MNKKFFEIILDTLQDRERLVGYLEGRLKVSMPTEEYQDLEEKHQAAKEAVKECRQWIDRFTQGHLADITLWTVYGDGMPNLVGKYRFDSDGWYVINIVTGVYQKVGGLKEAQDIASKLNRFPA